MRIQNAPRLAGLCMFGLCLSGVLVIAAYPPISAGWLAYIALVPFLLVLHRASGIASQLKWTAVLALFWSAGLFYFTLLMPDTTVGERIGAFAGVFVVILLQLFVFAVVAGRALQRSGFGWQVVLVGWWWAGNEWLAARALFGLSLFLGVTQWQYPPLVMLAGWVGLHGVSLLVMLTNATIVWALVKWQEQGRRGFIRVYNVVTKPFATQMLPLAAIILLAFAVVLVQQGARMNAPALSESTMYVPVATAQDTALLVLVQSSFSMTEYLVAAGDASQQEQLFARLLAQSAAGVGAAKAGWSTHHAGKPLPLIMVFWPETVLQAPVLSYPEYKAQTAAFVQESGAWLVAGLPWLEEADYFNSAMLINPQGIVSGRYDKVRTIPVAEGWATPGTAWIPLQAGEVSVGVGLCSEIIDPLPAKRLSAQKAEVLAFMSSLDYLGESAAPALQAAFAPFRAAEHGRYVAQIGSVGYTLVASPQGHITARLPWGTAGTLIAEAPLLQQCTRYDYWGDVLPVCGLLAGLFLVQPTGSRRRIKK